MPNEILVSAVKLAGRIAAETVTGNGGLAFLLQAFLRAYESGRAGALANYVAAWEEENDTGGLAAVGVPETKPCLPPKSQGMPTNSLEGRSVGDEQWSQSVIADFG
jgi:hypothetical protein